MIFTDITIVNGATFSRRTHDAAGLAPAAVEVFRGMFERHGDHFREPVPVRGLGRIELQWTRQGTAAVGTFWVGRAPLTTSALVPGLDADDDLAALRGVQDLVVKIFHGGPAEPAFDLLTLADRPLLATLVLPGPVHPDLRIIADAETCLAAAFFLSILEPD